MASEAELICKPFQVYGIEVSSVRIAHAINMLADAPVAFAASELTPAFPHMDYQESQEALNRLMQRWRKLRLATFKSGRWTLTKGAWDQMQSAARAATMGGSDD